MSEQITIQIREVSGITVLDLAGRIDAATSPVIEKELSRIIDSGEKNLILNMTELVYISSSGLRVVLAALKRVKPTGGQIVLSGMQPGPGEVFKMTGFDRLFPICGSVDEASSCFQDN